jgi:hypothetical protein
MSDSSLRKQTWIYKVKLYTSLEEQSQVRGAVLTRSMVIARLLRLYWEGIFGLWFAGGEPEAENILGLMRRSVRCRLGLLRTRSSVFTFR